MMYNKWFSIVPAGVVSLGLLAGGQATLSEQRQLESQADHSALMRAYGEAEGLYLKAADAAGRAAGAQHPDIGRILSKLALMIDLQDRAGAAEPIYQKAISLLEASASAAPADLAAALELYSGFLQKKQRATEAARHLERARPIRARLVRELSAAAPAPAGQPPAVKMAKGQEPPMLVSKVEPEYSDLARMAKLQGTVVLMIEVGVDGNAHNVQLVKGLGYGLDEKAAAAVLQWKFKPGSKDGQPVAVLATIEINFRLL
jgi:TonB family protein